MPEVEGLSDLSERSRIFGRDVFRWDVDRGREERIASQFGTERSVCPDMRINSIQSARALLLVMKGWEIRATGWEEERVAVADGLETGYGSCPAIELFSF